MIIQNREAKLRSALIAGFEAANLGLPFGIENKPFDKPDNAGRKPWAFVYYMPNEPNVATLGDDGEDSFTGLLQVDLNYPLNKGEGLALEKVGLLSSFFKAGKALTFEEVTAVVRSCGLSGQGREVDGWWRLTVRVAWYARISRRS